MNKHTVDCQTLHTWLHTKTDLILLDVRDEVKYQTGSLQADQYETYNIPYLKMKEQDVPLDPHTVQLWKDKPIITLCTSGNKAQKAAALLREQGLQAAALSGGLTAWKDRQNKESE